MQYPAPLMLLNDAHCYSIYSILGSGNELDVFQLMKKIKMWYKI